MSTLAKFHYKTKETLQYIEIELSTQTSVGCLVSVTGEKYLVKEIVGVVTYESTESYD